MNIRRPTCNVYPNGVYYETDTLTSVIELPSFLSEVGCIITENERDALIIYLAKYPAQGDEIQGTGGLRKLRWQSQDKGKRGGLRIIYFFYNRSAPVFLLAAYKKTDKEDLSQEGKRILIKIAQEIKISLKMNSRGVR